MENLIQQIYKLFETNIESEIEQNPKHFRLQLSEQQKKKFIQNLYK